MSNAKNRILASLRAGLAASPLAEPQAPPRPASPALPPPPQAWEELRQALAPLDTELLLAATPAEAARLAAETAHSLGARSWVRWDALPAGSELDAALAHLERLDQTSRADLTRADLGITSAQAALLESGTLALVAAPGQSRSASLLPPAHLCLVPRSALARDITLLPDLLRRHADASGQPPACLTFVSGPSSTADIELVLVRGVHGPGKLVVLGLDWDC